MKYTKHLSELKSRVEQYAKLPDKNKDIFTSSTSDTPKITKSVFFYMAPPIIIMVILFFMKPDFVCDDIDIDDDDIDIDDNVNKILNYKKILIAGLIGGGCISIALFAYFKKKK